MVARLGQLLGHGVRFGQGEAVLAAGEDQTTLAPLRLAAAPLIAALSAVILAGFSCRPICAVSTLRVTPTPPATARSRACRTRGGGRIEVIGLAPQRDDLIQICARMVPNACGGACTGSWRPLTSRGFWRRETAPSPRACDKPSLLFTTACLPERPILRRHAGRRRLRAAIFRCRADARHAREQNSRPRAFPAALGRGFRAAVAAWPGSGSRLARPRGRDGRGASRKTAHMTFDDDHDEFPHTSSPTADVLDNLIELYGYRAPHGGAETRPVPELDRAARRQADIFDAYIATLTDTCYQAISKGLLWGQVNLFHRAVERDRQATDGNEQAQRHSQKQQDGSNPLRRDRRAAGRRRRAAGTPQRVARICATTPDLYQHHVGAPWRPTHAPWSIIAP